MSFFLDARHVGSQLLPQGWTHTPALAGEASTTGPVGKSLLLSFLVEFTRAIFSKLQSLKNALFLSHPYAMGTLYLNLFLKSTHF